MPRKANYQKTFQHRSNPRGLTYDVGYRLIQRDDGAYVYGFEIVQAQHSGSVGGGAVSLDFEGSYEKAEQRLRKVLKEEIERLPEFRNLINTGLGRKQMRRP